MSCSHMWVKTDHPKTLSTDLSPTGNEYSDISRMPVGLWSLSSTSKCTKLKFGYRAEIFDAQNSIDGPMMSIPRYSVSRASIFHRWNRITPDSTADLKNIIPVIKIDEFS